MLRGQIDPSARVISAFERAGWAHGVRWPDTDRFDALRLTGVHQ
jgi:stearoyl-CoA desaturase (Delta-9 desaturase)